jgi:hypothetical protein
MNGGFFREVCSNVTLPAGDLNKAVFEPRNFKVPS